MMCVRAGLCRVGRCGPDVSWLVSCLYAQAASPPVESGPSANWLRRSDTKDTARASSPISQGVSPLELGPASL